MENQPKARQGLTCRKSRRNFRGRVAQWALTLALAGVPLVAQAAFPHKPDYVDGASWASLRHAVAGSISQQAKLTAGAGAGAEGEANDGFGFSVAMSGDTAMVGAWQDDVGGTDGRGSAYMFVRSGGAWTLEAKLTPMDDAPVGSFGVSIALSGNTAVVGASSHAVNSQVNRGSAFVFVREGQSWTQQARLIASDGAAGDFFGSAVAITGDTVLVGSPRVDVGGDADQGAAYVFERSGASWSQQTKLIAADGAPSDFFGDAVALSGDMALVGAWHDDIAGNTDQGSVYEFVRIASNWSEGAKLTASDGASGDVFGRSVAFSGSTTIIGAFASDVDNRPNQGAAYVFVLDSGNWSEQAKLTVDDGAAEDRFGIAVSLSGETAVIGADLAEAGAGANQGAAYVFTRTGTTWTRQARLSSSQGAANDRFGYAVAVAGPYAIFGSPSDDFGINNDQGSASVFERNGSDWTGEVKLDTGDGAAEDQFGFAVALWEDTALIGAAYENPGGVHDQGAAYVFVRNGPSWTLQTTLIAADGSLGDEFGSSVAIAGDTAVVASRESAYVFARTGQNWTQQAKLAAADGMAGDGFGSSVSISGGTAIVGSFRSAIGSNQGQGAAYVFVLKGSNWLQQSKLVADDGSRFDEFGTSVAVSGEVVIVGAPYDDFDIITEQGSAYVFERVGTAWTQRSKLVAQDGWFFDLFGQAVALSGDTALIGAPFDTRGSAYVFVRIGANWLQQDKLFLPDGVSGDEFGRSVALSGDAAVVGAPKHDVGSNDDQGSAHVFRRTGTSWALQDTLTASDGARLDNFGYSVAIFGGTSLVGAPLDNGDPPFGNLLEGAAYVFGDALDGVIFANSFE